LSKPPAQAPKPSGSARTASRRVWIGVAPFIASAAVTACPGALDNPDRFTEGGTSTNCATVALTTFQSSCSGSVCHSSADASTGLDLITAGVGDRLVGVPSSQACGERPLIDPANPEESLLLLKLEDTPPCGSRMPLGGDPLTAEQKACIRTWVGDIIEALGTGGSSGAGGRDAGGGTSGMAGSAGKAGTSGMGGSGGAAGTAGMAGKAGAGGSAGMAGSAGKAGSAGMAGMAGNAGMAGMSGNAGMSGMAGMSGSGGNDGGAGDGGAGGVADSGSGDN
ncbi:MAG TPA: hypothetical protein VK524_23415, partial [Polyangiaceae bacterium]|nr:hypothetical protein [Polyangiaceae bacterium]